LWAKQIGAGGLYILYSFKRHYLDLKYLPDTVLGDDVFRTKALPFIPTVSKVQGTGQNESCPSTLKSIDEHAAVLPACDQRVFDFAKESAQANVCSQGNPGSLAGSVARQSARTLGIYHQLAANREQEFGIFYG
jgi:hypothetical protein